MTTSVSECFPVHHCSVVPALSKPFRLMKWAYLKEKDSKRRRHGSRRGAIVSPLESIEV